MAERSPEDAPSKGGRNEAVAALAVGFICLMVGVPLWWRTTTTYRASLPYADITQAFKTQTVCTVPITLISCSPEVEGGQRVKELASQLERALAAGKDGSRGLSIDYSVYPRDCLTVEKAAIGEATSIQDLDEKLRRHQQGSMGNIYVYSLPKDMFSENTSVHMGSHRNLFIRDGIRSMDSAGQLIRSVIVPEESLYKHYKTARGVAQTVADLESMRSFRYTPGYELSFTLLVPEPHNRLPQWNLNQAQKVFLEPLLKQLEEFAELTVTSQVVYYMSLSVKPKQTPAQDAFYFPHNSLPHIITPIEAKLGSHVTNFPNLNFVVYVPPLDQSPLYIHSKQGEPVSSNAFLSPRWGGVLIYNSPTPDDDNATRPLHIDVDNSVVMPVFLSQLRLLLGIQNQPQMESVTVEEPGELPVLDWEYDSLLRRHCIENLASASATLSSLSQLLERISNIVINDDVAKQVYTAVESINDGHRYLGDAKLHPAFHASKRALIAAEKAFFDPSLLELLYFPEDQKFAIYIPLFLPICIPVLLSVVKAIQWIRQQRASAKQKTE